MLGAPAPGAYSQFFEEGPAGDAEWQGPGSLPLAQLPAGGPGVPAPPPPGGQRGLEQLPEPLPLSPEGRRRFKTQVGGRSWVVQSAALRVGVCLAAQHASPLPATLQTPPQPCASMSPVPAPACPCPCSLPQYQFGLHKYVGQKVRLFQADRPGGFVDGIITSFGQQ